MKIGLDIHGVIDRDPKLFSELTHILIEKGHEVHVITGEEITDKLINELNSYGINYNSIFSITSYHKSIGTHVSYYKNAEDGTPDLAMPLINPNKWDRTKADHAIRIGLDIHIDDSDVYGRFFPKEIHYIRYDSKIRDFISGMIS